MKHRIVGIHISGAMVLSLLGGCASAQKLWKKPIAASATAGATSESSMPASITPVADTPTTEFMTTPSGLKYKIVRASNGKKPIRNDKVSVHYKGWLDSGKVFDSSYDRGRPATFGVTQVIPGWTEGLQLMGEGGMLELEIPSHLAYGSRGSGNDVPPNATLHFTVELVKIL